MKLSTEVTLKNKYGFHARPSTSFSMLAQNYTAKITVSIDDTAVDGKSVMGLLTLGATAGTAITITADGEDAEEAVKALADHVEGQFGGIE